MSQALAEFPVAIEDEQKKNVDEILTILKTSENGITEEEAQNRIEIYGLNEIIEAKKRGLLDIFIDQFRDIMVLILIAAMALSLFLGEEIDAIVIGIIVVLNAVLGTVQEYRAERAIEALKELAAPTASVVREGRCRRVPSKELVPGDIIQFETGEKIPADARLISGMNLKIDEAILTGESAAVSKTAREMFDTNQIAEMKNMAFSSTVVTYGRGTAVVTKTGMRSQLGIISSMVQEAEEEPTPLEEKLNRLSKALAVAIVFISMALFALEFVLATITSAEADFLEILLLVISLAVSAIPEGLPAVITATLAIGTQQMARKKAIIRKLAAAQTLGTTTVIVSDKTGTLTKNEMTVRELFTLNTHLYVSGEGYDPVGEFITKDSDLTAVDPMEYQGVRRVIATGLMCNTSRIQEEEKGRSVIGDPTEGALVVLAEKAKVDTKTKVFEEIGEIPFESDRKRMTMIYRNQDNQEIVAFVKGAPEIMLSHCTHVLDNQRVRPIEQRDKDTILTMVQNMAQSALRVLLMASRILPEELDEYTPENTETNLTFLGIVGMMDPPRAEVKQSIRLCKQAGIRVIMNTGDHRLTAVEVAREIELYKEGDRVITGEELDTLNDIDLDNIINDITVVARVSPVHKVRILNSLKRKNHQVAMTGDGVNDAPALKHADIGVAMGITGTDITKEAADMVLADDNFATIVSAVEEGRSIYLNIKKFIRYLISANFDELLSVAVAGFIGLPAPFIAVQILWINLITDGLPALALGVDPKDPDLMLKPPLDPDENIVRELLLFSFIAGFLAFIATIGLFTSEIWIFGASIERARTMAFASSFVFEMFLVFTIRHESKSMFSRDSFNNKWLLLAVLSSSILFMMVIYIPILQIVFSVVALSLFDWLYLVIVCGVLVLILDVVKRYLPGVYKPGQITNDEVVL